MDSYNLPRVAFNSGRRGFQFHWMDSRELMLKGVSEGEQESFNSIEWIRYRAISSLCSFELEPFNSIEWILIVKPHQALDYFPSLSIPLNGFQSPRGIEGWTLCLNLLSIPLNGFILVGRPTLSKTVYLSIPLNGFCTITVYVHCGNPSISIIWILFH